jgi:hypothetical protein
VNSTSYEAPHDIFSPVVIASSALGSTSQRFALNQYHQMKILRIFKYNFTATAVVVKWPRAALQSLPGTD